MTNHFNNLTETASKQKQIHTLLELMTLRSMGHNNFWEL